MRYHEITEALDFIDISDEDITKDRANWTLRLDIDGTEYVFMIRFQIIDDRRESVFIFAAKSDGRIDMSLNGKGNAFKVMGIAVSLAMKYLEEVKPDRLSFAADPRETSRVILYDGILRRMAGRIHGYTVTKENEGLINWFIDRD